MQNRTSLSVEQRHNENLVHTKDPIKTWPRKSRSSLGTTLDALNSLSQSPDVNPITPLWRDLTVAVTSGLHPA